MKVLNREHLLKLLKDAKCFFFWKFFYRFSKFLRKFEYFQKTKNQHFASFKQILNLENFKKISIFLLSDQAMFITLADGQSLYIFLVQLVVLHILIFRFRFLE